MTTPNDWDDAPSPTGDPMLHAHKLGLHDVPEDDCPACRVDRGAALLDERRPGWWEDVDVLRLDQWSTCRCVLGQTFGSFDEGAAALNVYTEDGSLAHGFDSDSMEGHDLLTELWRSKISERRAR